MGGFTFHQSGLLGVSLRCYLLMMISGCSSVVCVSAGWIDPDTPDSAHSIISSDGIKYDLVMSDEFNRDGRDFADGEDR